MSPQPTVRADAPAADAAVALVPRDVRAVLVVDDEGGFVGILRDEDLLRQSLPGYLAGGEGLARVVDEVAADTAWRSLEGLVVRDLLPDRDIVPEVDADATLLEVADVLARAHASLVGVQDQGRLLGGITIDDLLGHLLGRR